MVVTMLCTVASRSWVAVTEMGFSPSIPTLQVFPTYDTSNHVHGAYRMHRGEQYVWWRLVHTQRIKLISLDVQHH